MGTGTSTQISPQVVNGIDQLRVLRYKQLTMAAWSVSFAAWFIVAVDVMYAIVLNAYYSTMDPNPLGTAYTSEFACGGYYFGAPPDICATLVAGFPRMCSLSAGDDVKQEKDCGVQKTNTALQKKIMQWQMVIVGLGVLGLCAGVAYLVLREAYYTTLHAPAAKNTTSYAPPHAPAAAM